MHVLQKNYLSFIVKNMKKNDVFIKKLAKFMMFIQNHINMQ